jgi:lysophospholipase
VADVSSSTASVSLQPDFEMSYQVWRPAGAPRAGILLLHGFGEHAARYDALGRYLAGRGFLIIAPDARGHGKSGGRRGHVLRFDQYLDDLDALMRRVRSSEPLEDWFVLGHSMGGLVALRYMLRSHDRYRGLIVSNPLLGLAVKVPVVKGLVGKLLSSVWPTLTMGNEIDPDHLSRDTSVGRAYMADPLVHHQVSTRWFTEMLDAVARTHAEAVTGIQAPTLFLLSTQDRIADASAARQLYDRLSCRSKELKVYEGLYHEIFNELEREAIFADVAGWLDQQLSSQPNKA